MNFFVTMKDPDSLYEGVTDAVNEQLEKSDLPEDERDAVRELRVEKATDVGDLFFEYGEYLTIEIDTDNKTARVVSVAELERNR